MNFTDKEPRYILLAQTLEQVRQSRAFTQKDIANRLGKPQSYVSKYESGERRIDVIELLNICSALEIEPQKILKEINEDSSV